jgi:hypothetical protein
VKFLVLCVLLDMVFIAKSLERIAHHATNIFEHVIYAVRGDLRRAFRLALGGAARPGAIFASQGRVTIGRPSGGMPDRRARPDSAPGSAFRSDGPPGPRGTSFGGRWN